MKEISLYTAVIKNEYGEGVYLDMTEEGLMDQVFEYVKNNWERELEDMEMPAWKDFAITAYFGNVEYEDLCTPGKVTVKIPPVFDELDLSANDLSLISFALLVYGKKLSHPMDLNMVNDLSTRIQQYRNKKFPAT